MIGYTEVSVDQLVSIFVSRNSGKTEWARRLAPLYIQYGKDIQYEGRYCMGADVP